MHTDEVVEALRAGLAFLERDGFTLVEAKRVEGSTEFYHISYRSEDKCREVGVAYFPAAPDANASVRNLNRSFNWTDAGAMYLKTPKFEEVPGEGVAKLSAYLAALKEVLLGDLAGILNGAPFEYDPCDWSPYK